MSSPAPESAEERTAFGDGRMTPQRRTIARAAEEMGGAFSVDELAAAVREHDPTIGTATLYRAVAAMESSGWLERVGERRGSALFARCSAGSHHHHHLICDGCGRIQATSCPVADDSLSAAERSGFTVTRHDVTLYGLCASCASDPEVHEGCGETSTGPGASPLGTGR